MNNENEEFNAELLEILENSEKDLLELEQSDVDFLTIFERLCRNYHNIKGTAGMLELNKLQSHIHEIESELIRYKETKIPKDKLHWFLKQNDNAKKILNNEEIEEVSENKPVVEKNGAVNQEFVSESIESLDKIASLLVKLESNLTDYELFNSILREVHSLKGSCDLFNKKEAGDLCHEIESLLLIHKKQGKQANHEIVNTILMASDLISSLIKNNISEGLNSEYLFTKELIKNLNTQDKEEELIKQKEEVVECIKVDEKKNEQCYQVSGLKTEKPCINDDKTESSIRVNTSLLDKLMALMGEMVLIKNQVVQHSNSTDDSYLMSLSQKLGLVTNELQEDIMKTRMQPIGNLLTKFQRVVRDLASSLNKKIILKLEGTETELDKSIIESIKDPLTHIIRNACDHGIESIEKRRLNNKNETGTIEIKAFHENGQVIVQIKDDGGGLSKDKIINKALEKQLLTKEQLSKYSESQIFGLIFESGFSTAEKVTNVSGRGVGMDVVKKNIEKIGGLIEIHSKENEGTMFTIKIPLTLAIIPALIISANEDKFAIPQSKVSELIKINKKDIQIIQQSPVYSLRGDLIPIFDLNQALGLSIKNETEVNVVVIKVDNSTFGLVVDEIIDFSEIVVKPLSSFLKTFNFYSGATVLGDGSVIFILDILNLYKKHFNIEKFDSIKDSLNSEIDNEKLMQSFISIGTNENQKYLIPQMYVHRLEDLNNKQFEYSGHQEVLRYRGKIIKVFDINTLMGGDAVCSNEVKLIILSLNNQEIGLKVNFIDDIINTENEIDQKLQNSEEYIFGNVLIENEIGTIFDVASLFYKAGFVENKNQKNILLVEDTKSIREKISQDLLSYGFNVFCAEDGLDGIKKLNSNKIDVIITDIEMPNMDGFDFGSYVKGNNLFKHLPLIAFSSKNTQENINRAKNIGFLSYIEKKSSNELFKLVGSL